MLSNSEKVFKLDPRSEVVKTAPYLILEDGTMIEQKHFNHGPQDRLPLIGSIVASSTLDVDFNSPESIEKSIEVVLPDIDIKIIDIIAKEDIAATLYS